MSDLAQNVALMPAGADTREPDTAKRLYWHLVSLYVQGSLAAVVVTFFLVFVGLEFTAWQWIALLLCTPAAVSFYMLPDIWAITRHYKPIGEALSRLERGEELSRDVASAALVRALNLPYLSFVRVTFLHGPMATVAMFLTVLSVNTFMAGGFENWQMLTFGAMIFFFASPTHAIFEYFTISRDIAPVIIRLSRASPRGVLADRQKELVAIRLRSKLLYLSIFVAALPLVFFAFSIVFKVDLLLSNLGVNPPVSQMFSLWSWLGGVALVCMIGALVMSTLTAREVSRAAATLAQAMRYVEQGRLDLNLDVTSTDEYADLFRGFNHMVEGLRDEVRMLEVTHSLSGELKLEALIQRIMQATTELLDADRSTLFVYDPKTDELWSSYAAGLETKQIRIPSSAGIAGAVFTTGKVENVVDAYEDPRFNQSVDRATGYRTRSMLCMPIVSKAGARIGVTQVLNKRNGAVFTPKDESRLRAFTAQIAVSLENAQLFDEVLSVKNYNESILKSTSNGMVTLDGDDIIVTANEAALSILKVNADELVDKPAAKFFSGENAWVMAALKRVEETGQQDVSVDANLKIGSANVGVNMTVTPLIGLDMEPIGTMLVFEDVTEEKRVKATMSRFMSKEVADQVLAAGESELGGKDQVVSILFSDIRQFTTIAEAMGARETVSMLNEYFAEMADIISQHSGNVDKYIGDAIMALFGAPFRRPQDADNAVAAANEMLVQLRSLNERRGAENKQPIDIGVGIATGEVIVGTIGSQKRMEYTAIGDSVNLASRLEGANKYYGSKILISESTVRAMKNATPVRELDLIRVKGKDRAIAVYEVLGYHDAKTFPFLAEGIERFNLGLAAYRAQDWQTAIAQFETVLRIQPGDGPSDMYVKRCLHYRENPPPPMWDGVWVLTDK